MPNAPTCLFKIIFRGIFMKTKRALSVLLAVLTVLLSSLPAFAARRTCRCDDSPVIIVNGMGGYSYYIDEGTENERTVFPPENSKLVSTVAAVTPGLLAMLGKNNVPFETVGIPAIYDLLKEFGCSPDGSSTYNVTAFSYKDSVDNYPEMLSDTTNEGGMAASAYERLPKDHAYRYTYDWRMSPLENADNLREFVELAKEKSGHDKVNLICCSMGGIQTMGYIYKYGTEDIDSISFMSATFAGVDMIGDILTKDIDVNFDSLMKYLEGLSDRETVNTIYTALKALGAAGFTNSAVDYLLENELDNIYNEVLIPIFGYMGGIWALCRDDKYEEAKSVILKDAEPDFVKLIDEFHYNVLNKTDEILYNAQKSGTRIHIFAHYDFGPVPLYKRSKLHNSDNILETALMGGFATVAPYGKTLGDASYKAKGTVCSDSSHFHVSPDRVIDASTCLFPENTWFVKGVSHVRVDRGSEYEELLWKLVFSKEQLTVHSFKKYPQFLYPIFNENRANRHAYGDVDGDGRATVSDARLALMCALEIEDLSVYARAAANRDGSDVVTTESARGVLRYVLGIEAAPDND